MERVQGLTGSAQARRKAPFTHTVTSLALRFFLLKINIIFYLSPPSKDLRDFKVLLLSYDLCSCSRDVTLIFVCLVFNEHFPRKCWWDTFFCLRIIIIEIIPCLSSSFLLFSIVFVHRFQPPPYVLYLFWLFSFSFLPSFSPTTHIYYPVFF